MWTYVWKLQYNLNMLSTMCVPKHEQLIMLSVCGTLVVCSPELRVAYYIKISLFKLRTMLELCCWAFVLSAQSFDVFVGASVPLVRPSSESPIISYVRCLNWRSYAAEPAVSSAQLCMVLVGTLAICLPELWFACDIQIFFVYTGECVGVMLLGL